MVIPLEFQKFPITNLLLPTQHKQVTRQLNKQKLGTVIIKTYGKSLSLICAANYHRSEVHTSQIFLCSELKRF